MADTNEPPDYAPYRSDDTDYFGAKDVVALEFDYILKMRAERDAETENSKAPDNVIKNDSTPPPNLVGLALSGGGIRSASFCLGVLQALSCNGWLKQVDYLSTVSGGGYIGTSLSWLLHKRWERREGREGRVPGETTKSSDALRFGLERDNFPYGTYPIAGNPNIGRIKGAMLRFLRQNAKFLTPGNGITLMSLVAVVLRNSILSFVLHGAALVVLFIFCGSFLFTRLKCTSLALLPGFDNSALGEMNIALSIAVALALLFLLSIPLYSVMTRLFGRLERWNLAEPYKLRRLYEKWFARLLTGAFIFAIVGSVAYVHGALTKETDEHASQPQVIQLVAVEKGTGLVEIKGRQQDAEQKSRNEFSLPTAIGFLTTLFGLASSIAAFFQTNKTTKARVPLGLLVALGVAALLFGMLLLAYEIYLSWMSLTPPLWVVWTLAVSVLLVAWFTNLNYVSVHRYYRDRLMETFMPQVEQVLKIEGGNPEACDLANGFRLSDMPGNLKSPHGKPAKDRAPDTLSLSPYHIINTNLILVASKIPKFRGRGGDNFVFTPNHCGSNATGWARTTAPPFDRMTLASAMAISGAAVNPNAGGGGVGITRQPLLATLMGLLNIRLGYWLPNPNLLADSNDEHSACIRKGYSLVNIFRRLLAMIRPRNPNFIYPGLGEVVLHKNLSECSGMLQLSDGGHFENLGLYELVRRKAKLIIVCDGGADPKFNFDDLANAIEKIRVDFGALIDLRAEELKQLVPPGRRSETNESDNDPATDSYAERPFLVKTITYADNEADGSAKQGTLIYLTTTFFRGLTADLYGYRRKHPQFPDEPTGDQFFDEQQFEAYRELGFQSACSMMTSDVVRLDETIQHLMPPADGCCDSFAEFYEAPHVAEHDWFVVKL